MNKLFVGFSKEVELPKGGYIFIGDEVPEVPRARAFNPLEHSLNLLEDLSYRKICDIVDIFDALFSRGDGTLTKDTGLDFLAEALGAEPRSLETLIEEPDRKSSTGHIWAYSKVRRILRSPVLRRVLCNPTNFSFNPNSKILARINRAELSDFDSLVLGLLLMAHFKGQLVIEDMGFYGRECHVSLIRKERLIFGCNFLGELPPKLRQAALLLEEKTASRARLEDAELLAEYAGLIKGTNAFNEFVSGAVS